MFSKSDEDFILRNFQNNQVILVTGAGFSLMAKNISGESLPTSTQFAEKVWKFLGYKEKFDNSNLGHLWDLVLRSGKPENRIIDLLNDTFKIKIFPPVYNLIGLPFWYRIYTLNVDNLHERIFEDSSKEYQQLKFPKGESVERDQSLLKTQIIHLNGAIPCRPSEIIFSRSQYAESSIDIQPLYHEFVTDYCSKPTIFLGTQLEEQLFEQYLERRNKRMKDEGEYRPNSFLILPELNKAKIDLLKFYNIQFIPGTTEDFLNWLKTKASEIPDRMETLRISKPSLFRTLEQGGVKESVALNNFGVTFKNVNESVLISHKKGSGNKKYLLGTSPSWDDILAGLDAKRDIIDEIISDLSLEYAEKKVSLFALGGSAGSGKSTVVKRTCLELARLGFPVYFNYSEEIPNPDDLTEALNLLKRRVILVFDNAELVIHKLPQIIEAADKAEIKPIIFISCRSSYLDWLNGDHPCIREMKKYKLGDLSDLEIDGIIKVLTENDLLGTLKNKSKAAIFHEFKIRAKSQLLVAMKEATTGKKFDVIILDEFNKIEPSEARFLALCTAITTDAGFAILKQEFIGFSSVAPNTALSYLNTVLQDIIIVIGHSEDRLILRHRVIADVILKNTELNELKNAYINVLSNLAHEISPAGFHSPKFNLYKNIINHKKIYRRFENKISFAREIYESIKGYFRNDFQFWLQFGSIELEGQGGDIELAENYLNQAHQLKPNHPIILNTLAHFYFKKSLITSTLVEAIECKTRGTELIKQNLSKGIWNEAATYSILCIGRYKWAKKWSKTEKELTDDLLEIRNFAEEGYNRNPGNQSLKQLHTSLKAAYLRAGAGFELDPSVESFFDFWHN